jgi:hypothetical protein
MLMEWIPSLSIARFDPQSRWRIGVKAGWNWLTEAISPKLPGVE